MVEHDPALEATSKQRRPFFLPADDLEVGQLICLHSRADGAEFVGMGYALQVLAFQLPFVVAQPLANPAYPPWTFNVADYNLLTVSEEFARAQREPGASAPQAAWQHLSGSHPQADDLIDEDP